MPTSNVISRMWRKVKKNHGEGLVIPSCDNTHYVERTEGRIIICVVIVISCSVSQREGKKERRVTLSILDVIKQTPRHASMMITMNQRTSISIQVTSAKGDYRDKEPIEEP